MIAGVYPETVLKKVDEYMPKNECMSYDDV